MARVLVAQTFRWHPNPNSTETDEYLEGSILEGDAAEAAIRYGFGAAIKEDDGVKPESAPERKAQERAPRNKGQ